MKKLKLELDTLAVQSFAASPDVPAFTGTVPAHQSGDTCRGSTCAQSCDFNLNTNCWCQPDTFDASWNAFSCVTGECQCYTGQPTYNQATCATGGCQC